MRRALPVTLTLTLLFALPLAAQRLTPEQLWSALQTGNRSFVTGTVTYEKLQDERALHKNAQMPPITVLACSDSRVQPELVFNQSLGSMLVVRSAGNVADDFGLATIEYALVNGWTKLLVVLAHENCDIVTSSLGGADPSTPALKALATRIRSSFVGVRYDSRDPANVRKAIETNARASAAQLLAGSVMIRDAAATERIKIVSAYYDMTTGEVKAID